MLTAERLVEIFNAAGLTEQGVEKLAQEQARQQREQNIAAIRAELDRRRAVVENDLLNAAEDPLRTLPTWDQINAVMAQPPAQG